RRHAIERSGDRVVKSVAVLAPEPIRPRMAGMGIRALEIARALSGEFAVRLLVPNAPAEAAEVSGGLEVAAAPPGGVGQAARGCEAGVVSGHAARARFHQAPGPPGGWGPYDPFPAAKLHHRRPPA